MRKIIGVLVLGLIAAPAQGATFTVASSAASGPGSLEAAIVAANAAVSADTMQLGLAGTGLHTLLAPAAGSSAISDSVVINGYMQSGAAVNTIANDASNALLRIEIDASPVTTIDGRGVAVIGGAKVADRDLISGNLLGIFVQETSTGVTIRGNLFGSALLDSSGFGEGEAQFAAATIALPNGSSESLRVWLPGFVAPAGRAITATATSLVGAAATGEFSACVLSTLMDEWV